MASLITGHFYLHMFLTRPCLYFPISNPTSGESTFSVGFGMRKTKSQAKNTITLATAIGSLMSELDSTPAIRGGIASPSACSDWLIPNISPCSDGDAMAEMALFIVGLEKPCDTETKGMNSNSTQGCSGTSKSISPKDKTIRVMRSTDSGPKRAGIRRIRPPWVTAAHTPM